ncbi:MAG: hypothetical protein KBB20_02630 [Bacteroidales bacterium]|jgi:hypothetical protein|nr:hypothetical protein [Bacteroidales bacterium]MDI9545618.1 hypothetical protein [Bacteroidota bacterium]HNZ80473.1 hypothetical protein [Bacteroidales bacterium]HOD26590.1 hypothetical protein [Bacteroidales bacterium]HOH23980.1 hypothetical protein [Bacteroidales bacterium]
MKTLEMTMKVVEDRSAPLMLTERNLPGMCCCTCCCSCCFGTGEGNGGSSSVTSPADLGKTLSTNKNIQV